MAYRRRQGISRASTFKEEICEQASSDFDENATTNDSSSHHHRPLLSSSYSFTPTSSSSASSLAAQAIKASAARRDPSFSFSLNKSSIASQHEHHRTKSLDAYGDVSKSGFWGVLAQKAKEILEDDNPSQQNDITSQKLKSHSFNTFNPSAPAQEGRTADHRTQINLQGSVPEDSNQASGAKTAHSQTNHQNQLKASRDVAMATAAKAKLLLRELKTVKADLAFAKARCAQLEEENKLLRDKEGREKGQTRADDDLIRLQLETLLAEKARLANENEAYSRENRFLREIVEYHQLTTQDVVYLDEGMEEVTELYPMDTNGNGNGNGNGVHRMLSMSTPHSPLSRPVQTKTIFSMQQQQHQQHQQQHEHEHEQDQNTSEDEDPPSPTFSISVSEDNKHAK